MFCNTAKCAYCSHVGTLYEGHKFGKLIFECENCGYVSDDLSKKRKNASRTMRSKRYTFLDGIKTDSKNIRKYMRNAILADGEKAGIIKCMEAYLYVAWASDYEGEYDLARVMRAKVQEILDSYSLIIKSERYKFFIADVYRRNSQFKEVIEIFSDCKVADKSLQIAINFEVDRSKAGDNKKYKFEPTNLYNSVVKAIKESKC